MRHIETGLDNNRFVHVLSGLEPGEEVMLTPPLAGSVADDSQRMLDEVRIPTREEAQKRPEARGAGQGRGAGPGGNGVAR